MRNAEFPGYSKVVNKIFSEAKKHAERKDINEPDPIYQVPVVVHIVYNTPQENISNELVYAQIARLNKDFRRLNADSVDTRAEFLPVAGDAGIEFYLAGIDPDGNPTGGITRTEVTREDFAPDFTGVGLDDVKQSSLGGVDSWDTDEYLNIWVCDLIGNDAIFQIFGFAYPPASAPNWPAGSNAPSDELEGVVIHYEIFGEGNPLATGQLSISNQGRTAVHEVGHYLGLRHIWGDAIEFLGEDGCAVDDGLDDTPNAATNAAQTCNYNKNTCTDSPVDFPDMIENYMDYAQDQCMNMFTQDQSDIMRSMLETARIDLADGSIPPTGIDFELVDASKISIFPNPTNGKFQIQFPSDLTLENFQVFDLKGRLVISIVNQIENGQLSIESAKAGAYMLRLNFTEGTAVKRLLIQ
ncbi:MAG: hypothetical protein ACJATS_001334 [Psychroserpens sp.]